MQKNKNIEFFGFSKMSFFRSAQPIWGPGKSTNKTKKIGSEAVFQKWLKPRAKLQSEQDIEKKRDAKSQNKQKKEQNR